MSKHVDPSIYRLQTRNPSEFWVNKQKQPPLKRFALSTVAKRQFLAARQRASFALCCNLAIFLA
jgi:hypothetical protein